MWRIEVNDIAERAILGLDKPVRQRVIAFLHDRVETAEDPRHLAEPLAGELRGLWRFRVGDYRIVCDIQQAVRLVAVLDVGHRSDVYRKTGR